MRILPHAQSEREVESTFLEPRSHRSQRHRLPHRRGGRPSFVNASLGAQHRPAARWRSAARRGRRSGFALHRRGHPNIPPIWHIHRRTAHRFNTWYSVPSMPRSRRCARITTSSRRTMRQCACSRRGSSISSTAGLAGSHIQSTTAYYENGQVSSTQSPSEYAAGVSTAFSYDADGNDRNPSLRQRGRHNL